MTDIPLTTSDVTRQVAKSPTLSLRNRFVEGNQALNEKQSSVISRPALKKFIEVGDGPIRKVFSQPGTFDERLFAVSGNHLYGITTLGASTDLGQLSLDATGGVSMAATAPIGDTVPAYLWIAEGGILWCYTNNGFALGQLQASGAIANNDTIVLNGTYYKWTSGSVDTGSPAGTAGNPWLVALGVGNADALTNMYNAVGATGIAGTDYSTSLTAHPTMRGSSVGPNDLYVMAQVPGTAGNAYTTTETGANISWGGATLSGGGTDQIRQVYVPDDVGAISVAVVNSYVIVIPVQSDLIKGRFYYVQPGEAVIDPLDFATAERSPDGVHQVVTYGDMFWLMGQTTTEPWVTSGNPDAPMQRFQGILFDRGSWEGTALQLKDSLMVIDQDGGVFMIKNGQTRVTSQRPDIEERIRKAILST